MSEKLVLGSGLLENVLSPLIMGKAALFPVLFASVSSIFTT
jgi:hypothetical protein